MGSPSLPGEPTAAPQQAATPVVVNGRRIRRPVGICQYRWCHKRFSRQTPDQRFCWPEHRNAEWRAVHRPVPASGALSPSSDAPRPHD